MAYALIDFQQFIFQCRDVELFPPRLSKACRDSECASESHVAFIGLVEFGSLQLRRPVEFFISVLDRPGVKVTTSKFRDAIFRFWLVEVIVSAGVLPVFCCVMQAGVEMPSRSLLLDRLRGSRHVFSERESFFGSLQ